MISTSVPNRLSLLAVFVLAIVSTTTEAFSPCAPNLGTSTGASTLTALSAESSDNDNRRQFLRSIAGAALGASLLTQNSQEASASYSAYAAREKDWEDRSKSGEVTYSTSRDLKRQLREVAPMNSSKSLMFCPNGPSSAVSPLMENKCDGDRMATPSVFGRTEDTVGNSIPGFSGGKYGGGIDTSANLASQVGFPKY